jgi:hypothetical protein
MKWLPIMRKDGEEDPYACGYCTHTIATIFVYDKPRYEAWRLSNPPEKLGGFPSKIAAQQACQKDLEQMARAA